MQRVDWKFNWQKVAAFCLPIFVAVAGLAAFAVAGLPRPLAKQAPPRATVVFFLSTDCPVAMKYSPRIQKLVEVYKEEGIAFRAYFPNDLETAGGIARYAFERQYNFPVEIDVAGKKAKAMGVTMVPTVILLNRQDQVVYKGAIDDNKDSSLVKTPYLAQAIDATLKGSKPTIAKSEPFGCVLMAGDPLPHAKQVTYAEHIKPIIDRACVSCHRPGEVAPFSLVGYANAKKWVSMIEIVTQSRKMPPWKAVHAPGEFESENVLAERELELIKLWNEGGTQRGESKTEPADPKFSSSPWSLGQPDLILTPEKPFRTKADGADDYRHFILKTNFKETRYIKAMDVKPGNTKVVHHVIAFLDANGASHRLDGKDGQIGYSTFGGPGFLPSGSFGGWAPGLRVTPTPAGKAYALPPNCTIVMQVHYHPTGKEESDQTQLGLYFAKEPIEQEVELSWMANYRLNIPAGDPNHKATVTTNVPSDITLYSLMPHMHLLGKQMKATAIYPDGRQELLIWVRDWDFNWQMQYTFSTPRKIPGGSKIMVEAIYDNSANNPNNPSRPPKDVRWGEETTDEMHLMVASYTVDGARRPVGNPFGFGRKPQP